MGPGSGLARGRLKKPRGGEVRLRGYWNKWAGRKSEVCARVWEDGSRRGKEVGGHGAGEERGHPLSQAAVLLPRVDTCFCMAEFIIPFPSFGLLQGFQPVLILSCLLWAAPRLIASCYVGCSLHAGHMWVKAGGAGGVVTAFQLLAPTSQWLLHPL